MAWPFDVVLFMFDPHCCLDSVIAESLENPYKLKLSQGNLKHQKGELGELQRSLKSSKDT